MQKNKPSNKKHWKQVNTHHRETSINELWYNHTILNKKMNEWVMGTSNDMDEFNKIAEQKI